MTGLTLDTGALIAIEAGSPRMAVLIEQAMAARAELAVPAGVVAQAWRGGARQVRIAKLLQLQRRRLLPSMPSLPCALVPDARPRFNRRGGRERGPLRERPGTSRRHHRPRRYRRDRPGAGARPSDVTIHGQDNRITVIPAPAAGPSIAASAGPVSARPITRPVSSPGRSVPSATMAIIGG